MEQYEVIYRQRVRIFQPLPSVEELIELRIAHLTHLGVATELDLRKLATNITDRKFQFFAAWPKPRDYDRWIKMIDVPSRISANYLCGRSIKDVIRVPKGLFLGLDVDDGWNRRNVAPLKSRDNILSEGRVPFTARMGVCYVISNPIALDGVYAEYERGEDDLYMSDVYEMDCVGSASSGKTVPSMRFRDGKATIGCHYSVQERWWAGAASCGKIISLDD
jgi:hypothetical protein